MTILAAYDFLFKQDHCITQDVTEQVHVIAKQLKTVADQVSATTEILLGQTTSSSTRRVSSTSNTKRSNTAPNSFNNIWRLEPDGSDPDMLSFRSWSAVLLHLMIHKASCVLYYPLFQDPAIVISTLVRIRFYLLIII